MKAGFGCGRCLKNPSSSSSQINQRLQFDSSKCPVFLILDPSRSVKSIVNSVRFFFLFFLLTFFLFMMDRLIFFLFLIHVVVAEKLSDEQAKETYGKILVSF